MPIALLGLLLAVVPPAWAQPASAVTEQALQTMVDNLGYPTTMNQNGTYFSIKVSSGPNSYPIGFRATASGNLVIDVNMVNVSVSRLGDLDMRGLLTASDGGPNFFSLSTDKDTATVWLQRSMPNSGITPVLLRSAIDALVGTANATVKLWSSDALK